MLWNLLWNMLWDIWPAAGLLTGRFLIAVLFLHKLFAVAYVVEYVVETLEVYFVRYLAN
jgi:hypothetical protein